MIVCRGFKLGAELLRQAAAHTRAYLSLGLDVLSGGSAAKMAELLRTRWLEDIFRVGFSRAAASREKLLSCLRSRWKGDVRALADFFGAPYGRSLELFARKQPRSAMFRAAAPRAVAILIPCMTSGCSRSSRSSSALCSTCSPRGFSSPARFSRPVLRPISRPRIHARAAVGTALCRLVLGREISFAPVSLRDFKAFLKSAAPPRRHPGGRLRARTSARRAFRLRGGSGPAATAALALNVLVDLIEKEFESYAGRSRSTRASSRSSCSKRAARPGRAPFYLPQPPSLRRTALGLAVVLERIVPAEHECRSFRRAASSRAASPRSSGTKANQPQILPDLLLRLGRGDQLPARRKIDAVRAGEPVRRAAHAHVDFLRPPRAAS